MAQCDGQHLGHIPSRAANQNATVDVEVNASSNTAKPHVGVDEDASLSTSSTPTETPLSESAPVDARARAAASVGAPARPEPRTRAQQSIPPALRRAVLLRDPHRCQVPGCRNTTFLDLHHIQLHSEGGRWQRVRRRHRAAGARRSNQALLGPAPPRLQRTRDPGGARAVAGRSWPPRRQPPGPAPRSAAQTAPTPVPTLNDAQWSTRRFSRAARAGLTCAAVT
jgi:hypothetical protein